MTTVGAWTLLIEPNGYLGVTEERALPASAGTGWISHFVNINAVGTFLWAEDQALRLCFDPMFPEDRWGTAPDELLDVMTRIGFHVDGDAPETEIDLSSPAAFALAEHLTGVPGVRPPACEPLQGRGRVRTPAKTVSWAVRGWTY